MAQKFYSKISGNAIGFTLGCLKKLLKEDNLMKRLSVAQVQCIGRPRTALKHKLFEQLQELLSSESLLPAGGGI